ncbi:hypothetical protein GCM10010406_50640 [Streptomyces thermolineatus]|uniref:Uncharacterized protein n=1 Tax=Streptomyces thermolineatus TaxID=44033 RepID=A0ABN3MSG3_9ACTN
MSRNGGTLHLADPWVGHHEHGYWSAEIGYASVDDLRAALSAVPAPDPPRGRPAEPAPAAARGGPCPVPAPAAGTTPGEPL